ncbi:MAG: energy transducer TonB [bacterium]
MFKAKEVSIKNLSVYLVFSVVLTAGYLITHRPMTMTKNAPIFYGEEVKVSKATAVLPAQAVIAKPIQVATPAAKPTIVTPLPIIPPAITFKVLPVYPASILAQGQQGTVILSVFVGLSGQAEKIETKLSSGLAGLDEAATKAVSQWRFSPASQGGTALASWFEVPVRFVVR